MGIGPRWLWQIGGFVFRTIIRSLNVVLLSLTLVSASAEVWAKGFPTNPDPRLTPGSLCNDPDETRYPERIAYCKRDVSTGLKKQIIAIYDQRLGYSVGEMNRQEFKIDHFIPLCAGGSNTKENLWPQHRTVYQQTDPLEPVLCEKMQSGRLRQADAIRLIREAKLDLTRVEETLEYIENL